MGFPRQEYRSRLAFPPPGDLPYPGIKPASLTSPALAGGFFITGTTWEVQGNRHKYDSFTWDTTVSENECRGCTHSPAWPQQPLWAATCLTRGSRPSWNGGDSRASACPHCSTAWLLLVTLLMKLLPDRAPSPPAATLMDCPRPPSSWSPLQNLQLLLE